ncbi:hypothetical protein B0E37_02190 [Streptomyces sp. MH192]|nr:hypothetical protein [Streptomyces sp. MH192]MCF0099032.1 hypothetical protein [Streptomyces sp. MH191]
MTDAPVPSPAPPPLPLGGTGARRRKGEPVSLGSILVDLIADGRLPPPPFGHLPAARRPRDSATRRASARHSASRTAA